MSSADNLNDRIDNQIELLLKDVAAEERFKNFKIEKAPGSMKGDGYMGVITTITIKGKSDSGRDKTLHLIVKAASKSDAVRVETSAAHVFDREIYMYNSVIPVFIRFERERNLPPFSSSAKCYKACMIEKSEALILENLKENGYSVWERRIPMEHDHVSLVMSEYGHFHAISLAMKDQEPERFKNLTDNLDDIFDMFMKKADYIKMFRNQCEKALKSLDENADKKGYITFKKFLDNEFTGFIMSLSQQTDDYSVIVHGDCWTNNMLFKYDDKNNPKKPTKMCLIDLQISRLGSVVLDLSYFLYACSSKKVLDNYEHYLDVYYDSLFNHIQKMGSNPEKLYPRTVFREHWKKYSRFGLIFSALLIHVMLSEQEEVTDFAELTESGKSVVDAFNYDIGHLEVYNDRVRHVILHFVNNGFIC